MAVNRDKVLREAEKLVQKGKIEQAIKEYQKLLKANPNDANTINRIGELYSRLGKTDKAVELYERLADHYQKVGFVPKAIAMLTKIHRIAPDRHDVVERLAELHTQQGRMADARSLLQQLADWYQKHDQLEEAARILKKLVQLDPANQLAQLKRADILMRLGNHEEALEVYDSLGRSLLEDDKLDEAERLYRHVLDANPPSGEIFAPLCEKLIDAKRFGPAKHFVEEGLKRSPQSPLLAACNLRLLASSGDSFAVLSEAKRILQLAPEDEKLRRLAAEALLMVGEATEAKRVLLPIVQEKLKTAEYEEAARLLNGLLRALPQDEEVLRLGLKALVPLQDQQAVVTLKEALAEILFRRGKLEEARRLFMELMDTGPRQSLYRERIAQIDAKRQVATGAWAETPAPEPEEEELPSEITATELEIGITPEPTPAIPEGFDPHEKLATAEVFDKYGLVSKAIEQLEEILKYVPDMHQAREKLVRLLVGQGKLEEARQVAKPLEEHYRATGADKELEALHHLLGVKEEEEAEELVIELEEPLEEHPSAEELPKVEVVTPVEEFQLELEPGTLDLEVELPEPEDEQPVLRKEPLPFEGPQQPPAPQQAAKSATPGKVKRPVSETGVFKELAELEKQLLSGRGTRKVVETKPPQPQAPPKPRPQEVVEEELMELGPSFAGPTELELQQLDLMITQGLFNDALRLLEKLETEYPDDPELAKRRAELKAKGVLLEEVGEPVPEEAEELFEEEAETFVDLGKELEKELEEEAKAAPIPEDAELERVFMEFKKGVAEQLSEEDSDTHFNLGIAYKEMGLLLEAISEFQIAAKDPAYKVEACLNIGQCYLEQGLAENAIEWYRRALETEDLAEHTRLGILYELGLALEQAGDIREAMAAYGQVLAVSPTYRDVAARLESLNARRQAQ